MAKLETLCRVANDRYPIELENLIAQGQYIVKDYKEQLDAMRKQNQGEKQTHSLVIETQHRKRLPIIKAKMEYSGPYDDQEEDKVLQNEYRRKRDQLVVLYRLM